MKRWLAALLALLLMHSCALAQGERPIALYELPDGAQVRFLSEAGEFFPPEGMDAMYELMNDASWLGNVYLIQMAGGYAMASVSCREVANPLTAEELLSLWPRIAADLSFRVEAVDSSPECAAVERCFGMEMLHIRTPLTLRGGLCVEAEGFAFCRDNEITEIWAVAPPEDALGASMQVRIQNDREDLAFFIQSLEFPESTDQLVEGEPYESPDGAYRLMIPAGASVLTADSTQEEISAVREQYVSRNSEGAAHVFDTLMEDLSQTGASLIFTQDMQGVVELSANRSDSLSGVTTADLGSLNAAILDQLQTDYEIALCMESGDFITIDGRDHAFMDFWVRHEDMNLQLDLMACVCEEGWLYEADVFVSEGDQALRALLHACIAQTLQYTPPVNGLD